MFCYYQRLLQIRHQYPALTEGTIVKQYVKDEIGLISIERIWEKQTIQLIFHAQKGSVELPEQKGIKNLINNQDFTGSLGDYEVAVLFY